MAIPQWNAVTEGTTDAAGAWTLSLIGAGVNAQDVVIVHLLQDGGTAGAVALTTSTDIADLAGTANSMTYIGAFAVGGSSEAIQHLWIGRTTDQSVGAIGGTNSTSEDIYARMYRFKFASTGTTLDTVIENVTAGSTTNSTGTSGTIADASVQTLGVDRLALNFVVINDDNAIGSFTGMTGGTWAEISLGEYADSTGTDGCIQLQTAEMATAGTIAGGTMTNPDATDAWGVVGFALIGTTVETARVPFTSPYPQLLAQ